MARPTKLVAPDVWRCYLSNPAVQTSKLTKTQGFTNKDHLILKKEIMWFSSANRDYFNIIALLKCVYWFKLVCKMNDVANGSLVFLILLDNNILTKLGQFPIEYHGNISPCSILIKYVTCYCRIFNVWWNQLFVCLEYHVISHSRIKSIVCRLHNNVFSYITFKNNAKPNFSMIFTCL